jgi:RecA/RadA recombinase
MAEPNFADILKISKKGLSGNIQNSLVAVRGRLPNMLSTGSLFLDYRLNGGFVKGQCQQIYGPSGAGKSTWAYRMIAANQFAAPGLITAGMESLPNFLPGDEYGTLIERPVCICDAEGGLTEGFIGGCGVRYDTEKFLVFYPETGEDWFTYLKRFCLAWFYGHHTALDKEGKPTAASKRDPNYLPPITIVDSLDALVPKSMLEDEQNQIAYLARLLSNFLPLNCVVGNITKMSSLWIQQIRINPMQLMGSPERTKGGEAAKFHASGRFRCSAVGPQEDLVDSTIGAVGKSRGFMIAPKKCRWAPVTGDKLEILTFLGRGFSRMSDMWNFAVASKQIIQNGAWYQLKVIGRPDLDINKNVRGDDLKKYFREKNLWEVFVKQVFTGSAWGDVNAAQLEILANIATKDFKDHVGDEEFLATEAARLELEAEAAIATGIPEEAEV